MLYTEKGTVEDFIIKELQKLGWKHIEPKQMDQRRRQNFEEPLSLEDLKQALKRINSNIELTEPDLSFVLTSLRTLPPNIEGIRKFLDIFRNGLLVPSQKERRERVLKLVDLTNIENNEFVVTCQFKLEGFRTDRLDVILFVNGIPLVLIECKNPTQKEVGWKDAYDQIKRYEEEIPEIFKYVQFSIATDGIGTYYFPNAYRPQEEERNFLSVWKDPYPFKKEEFKDDLLKIAIYGLLSKSNLLNLIENFIFIRKEKDKETKIMTRYMQYRATEKIFERVKNTLQRKEDEKFGLIWHWQGSGKTYTIAFSARKLYECLLLERPSIFVMVDRKDLEEQVEKDFSFIQIPIEKINSIKELIEVLRWGKEGKRGIFLVTVEKFAPKEFEGLKQKKIEIERENVIVLADEVHRTQYGKFATMWRSIFKNAFIFGFTGTPLFKAERNTFQRFCPKGELYLDRYSMLDAIEDGFTVELSYQARLPQYYLDKQQLKEFTKFEEEEIKTLRQEEQKELKRKIRIIKAFIKSKGRVEKIAEDIASHFKEVVEPSGLKAMVVVVDREACVLYKNALDNFLSSDESEVVMTFGQNPTGLIKEYLKKLEARYQSKEEKEIHNKIIDNFKSKEKPKLLIVTDMLITGFDAPVLWTMYLDKPLKEHRLLQAIARTNRPFSNKQFGLINDYIGVLPELEEAFENFEAKDARDLKLIFKDLNTWEEKFKELMTKALGIFEGIKRENTYGSLREVVDFLKVNPEKAEEFEGLLKELTRCYEMLQGYPFLRGYLFDYKWLVKVFIAYNKDMKKVKIDELKIEELSKKTARLIQQTIDVKAIEEMYPIVRIDEEYIKAIHNSVPKNRGAAIDILTTIQHEIKNHPNSPFFIDLSKEVERIYEELKFRKFEITHVIEKLREFLQKILQWKKEEQEIGKEKYPIYEVIKTVIPELDKEVVVKFVNELMKRLKEKGLVFKDWHLQRDNRRKVREEIRIFLFSKFKKHKAKIDELSDKVFEALERIKW